MKPGRRLAGRIQGRISTGVPTGGEFPDGFDFVAGESDIIRS